MTTYDQYEYNLWHKRRDAKNIFDTTRETSKINKKDLQPYNPIKPDDLSLEDFLKSKKNKFITDKW